MTEALVIASPVGRIEFVHHNQQITQINLNSPKPLSRGLSGFESDIEAQVNRYFTNPKHQFSLPLAVVGTEHQNAVWLKMREIPAGTVKTYGEIAKLIGSSAQAVGNACRRNPIPIIVPCHRIVAANAIGGFAGATQGALLVIKQSLLAHEGVSY